MKGAGESRRLDHRAALRPLERLWEVTEGLEQQCYDPTSINLAAGCEEERNIGGSGDDGSAMSHDGGTRYWQDT